jgi:hypothetical protein
VQNSILIALMARGLTAGFASECFGQLTVQQPVIQSIGGNFAVSVPDRGGILLGSISRAGESRKSYGLPFTRGSSVGRFSQRSSLSSHVWIHDLREMDRMILEVAETDPQGLRSSTSVAAQRAGLAWSDYQPRRGVSVEDRRPSGLRASQRFRSTAAADRSSAGFRRTSRVSGKEPGSAKSEPVTVRRSRALDPDHSYPIAFGTEFAPWDFDSNWAVRVTWRQRDGSEASRD